MEKTDLSNWKEFANLVDRIEGKAEGGKLKGAVIFLFTDNSTVEGAVHRGNSKSKKLFKLVCKLRKLQMRYGFMIFVIHVSGTRMIEQGTDGLSRGLFNQGALATGKIRLYAPINLSALDRTMDLKPWIITWAPANALFLLLS